MGISRRAVLAAPVIEFIGYSQFSSGIGIKKSGHLTEFGYGGESLSESVVRQNHGVQDYGELGHGGINPE